MLPCSGAAAFGGLQKASSSIQLAQKLRGRANMLVIGVGGLGLWSVSLAANDLFPGCKIDIFVADLSEEKISTAMEVGASEGFVLEQGSTLEGVVKSITKDGTRKMDVVFNYVGNAYTCELGVGCLHSGGALVLSGLMGATWPLAVIPLVVRSIAVLGTRTCTLQQLRELVRFVSEKGIEFPNVQFFSLDKINDALGLLRAGNIKGRAMIQF